MGLIYNPSESQGLVSALNTNIRTATEMIDNLNSASKHLIDALNEKTLSGAAYTAGKGMFSQLILPTISKASQSLEHLKSEAQQYEGFASSAGGELLDEDKLNEQLQALQSQQAALTSQISFYNQQATLHPENSDLNTSYADFSKQLSSYMGTTAGDIQKVQDKLKRLHTFNDSVNGLFINSLEELKSIVSLISVIGLAQFDKSGEYSLNVTNSKELNLLEDLSEQFRNKASDGKEWFNESLSRFLEKTADKVIKEGKNIGRSWGAKLQPRVNGKFVTDDFAPRRWLSGKLKGVSESASNSIGSFAKWGGRGLVALGAVENFNDYNAEYHNNGRALVYSGISTTASYWVAGTIGVSVGTVAGAAVTTGLVSAGAIAAGGVVAAGIAIAAPVAGAIVVGVAAGMVVKAAYDGNFLGTKDAVNFLGDKVNDIGKAFSSPLKSFKGAFGW